jgi:hypothetical protein
MLGKAWKSLEKLGKRVNSYLMHVQFGILPVKFIHRLIVLALERAAELLLLILCLFECLLALDRILKV